jgi:hypothetical protein
MESMNTQKDYQTRLVSLIDILGWTKATDQFQFDELLKVIIKAEEMCESYSEQHKEYLVKQKVNINPLFFEVKFSMFSDTLAISMPPQFEARICDFSAKLIRKFIVNGFLLRGGITKGRLHHNNQTIFGSALVRAHKLESESAKFARILIERETVNTFLESDSTSVIKDHLGDYVVDPFPLTMSNLTKDILDQMYELEKLIDVIDINLKKTEGDLSAFQKWKYFTKLASLSLSKFGPLTDKCVLHLEERFVYKN